VAVEEENTRVGDFEAKDDGSLRVHFERVPPHRHRGESTLVAVEGQITSAMKALEFAPVHVEGVAARVVVVDHDLNNLPLSQYKAVGGVAVHAGVESVFADGQSSVEGWHLLADIRSIGAERGAAALSATSPLSRYE
jgi:hypothetical protein